MIESASGVDPGQSDRDEYVSAGNSRRSLTLADPNPFYRRDESRSPKTGSAGLGLAIARDVVRGYGGDLTLEDSPIGSLHAPAAADVRTTPPLAVSARTSLVGLASGRLHHWRPIGLLPPVMGNR